MFRLPAKVLGVQFAKEKQEQDQSIACSIVLQVFGPIKEQIAGKMIFVGSVKGADYDQELCDFKCGTFSSHTVTKIDLVASCPNYNLLPPQEKQQISALIISLKLGHQQFIRIGFYIYYQNEMRIILSKKPRIYKYSVVLPPIQQKFEQCKEESILTQGTQLQNKIQSSKLQFPLKKRKNRVRLENQKNILKTRPIKKNKFNKKE